MITAASCPVCGRTYTLDADGRFPLHLVEGSDRNRPDCDGTGELPAPPAQ